MRHGRAKAARKTLQYFGRTIGLKAPYSILLDATFVATLFQQKILPVKPRLDRVLQTATTTSPNARGTGSVNKYYITQAAVDELKEIQDSLQKKMHVKAEAFKEALEWIQRECILLKPKEGTPAKSEEEHPIPKSRKSKQQSSSTPAQEELLREMEENKDTPYIVASQDEELLDTLRKRGTVPIVRLANNTVLLLEQPSKSSQTQSKGMERQKWKHSLPEAEKALVELVREQERRHKGAVNTEAGETTAMNQQPQRQRIKKAAKGPNPLSCKRKQRPESGDNSNKESNSKKRRKRVQQKKEGSGDANRE